MTEEIDCPISYGTSLYKRPPCGGKITRREPILSHDLIIGHIPGPTKIEEARALDDMVPYYIYECENGHTFTRPDGWADVPTVPPGTIVSHGYFEVGTITNKPPLWYTKLSDEEKDNFLKK